MAETTSSLTQTPDGPRWDRRRFLRRSLGTLAGALIVPSLGWCLNSAAGVTRERTLWAMGGWQFFRVSAADEATADHALDQAVAEVRRIDRTFSVFDPRTPLSQLNSSRDLRMNVDDPLVRDGCAAALKWAQKTDGAFDPTVEPLMRQYGFRDGSVRGQATNAVANYQVVDLDYERSTLVRESREIQLDPGGWAKGWAAERAALAAHAAGAETALANCGGDLFYAARESSPNTTLIRKPSGRRDEFGLRIRHRHRAVATSANYENHRLDDQGNRLGHLMDATTGRPVNGSLESVTVLTNDGLAADAIASALFVMGRDRSVNWLKQNPEFGAVLLESEWDKTTEKITVVGDVEVSRA